MLANNIYITRYLRVLVSLDQPGPPKKRCPQCSGPSMDSTTDFLDTSRPSKKMLLVFALLSSDQNGRNIFAWGRNLQWTSMINEDEMLLEVVNGWSIRRWPSAAVRTLYKPRTSISSHNSTCDLQHPRYTESKPKIQI